MPTTPSSLSHAGGVVVAVVTVATVQSVGLSASRTGLLSRLPPSHVQGRGGRGRCLEGLHCPEELTEMGRWADAGVGGIRELACSHLVQHVLPTPLFGPVSCYLGVFVLVSQPGPWGPALTVCLAHGRGRAVRTVT